MASMPPIIMNREFIARSTKMPRSIGRLSASAQSHHGLSLAVFITNIAESDFRYTQPRPQPPSYAARKKPRCVFCRGFAFSIGDSRMPVALWMLRVETLK
jgi:hypothetical protein